MNSRGANRAASYGNQRADEYEALRSKSESSAKLVIKMRSLSVKRPKCRSKLIVMAIVGSAALLIFAILLYFTDLPTEAGVGAYNGE